MEELRKAMTSFGFMIIQTLVTDIEPDMKVRAAMNEINAAQRLRWASVICAVVSAPVCSYSRFGYGNRDPSCTLYWCCKDLQEIRML